ncbi:uncharacterized protein LOC133195607 [Saccostrea echinata]|uniref:uncharacterized protein LOC133195607 n=1 Tax=Saccostrea echinata TaxID=191078 RepID=UPI002A82FF76|nr:uncharacterized protein LOC133195607 [Saccostrea echinata]
MKETLQDYCTTVYSRSGPHVDKKSTKFPIRIISASTEVWSGDTTYSVEFETTTEHKARVAWFLYHMDKRIPVVFGDPSFSSSLSYQWPYKNRRIARLRTREEIDTLVEKKIEFSVTHDQSTVAITFDDIKNTSINTTTTQSFDDFQFDISVINLTQANETTNIEFGTSYEVSGSAKNVNDQLVLSRYIVEEIDNSTGRTDVKFLSTARKISDKKATTYSWEYNDTALVLDITEINIAYEKEPDAVINKMVLRSEYHFWERDQQQPLNGIALFEEYDITNPDKKAIKIAHCEGIGDVTIKIGLRGKNGIGDIPPGEIPEVQINYGYFREAFALLRYYSGKLEDYEAYCFLQ